MHRTAADIPKVLSLEEMPGLWATSVCFLIGGLLGCLLALRVGGNGEDALRAYLDAFLEAAREDALCLPALPGVIWRFGRWPLAAFLLGFTALGLLGIPVLSGLRGFFLAFSIASFVRVYGRAGLKIAFLLLGLTGLVALPTFFLLCVQSFGASRRLADRGSQNWRDLPYHRDYFLRAAFCAGAVVVCIFMEYTLLPVLLPAMLA